MAVDRLRGFTKGAGILDLRHGIAGEMLQNPMTMIRLRLYY
jgi:hypothetical protein